MGTGVDKARFKIKARRFIAAHQDHIALIKLHRGDPLTKTDLVELEKMLLIEEVADQETLENLKLSPGLGVFFRSLTGLDRSAAKQAFSQFAAQHQLTGDQNEFLNLMIESLCENGTIDPRSFYESPYTDLDSMGLVGVFQDGQAEQLVEIVKKINAAAAA